MTPPRKPSPPRYLIGDVTVERENFRVRRDGETVTLTPRAFDVLLFLIEHRGRVVEKQELFEQVWKESFVTDNALTRAVKEVRRALGDDADAPRFIETVHRRGYRFIAEVEETAGAPLSEGGAQAAPVADEEESRAPAVEPAPAEVEPAPAPQPEARRGPSRARLFVPLGVAAVLALAALVVWRVRRGTEEAPPQALGIARTVQVTLWPGLDDYPSISPDGNSVAYCSDHGGSFEIYVKALAPGAKEVQLTAGGGQNFQPAFSPDGRQVAFYSNTRGGIWVVPSSGGEPRQLTEFGSAPAWSPDGRAIVFQSKAITDLGADARNALSPSTIWLVSAQGGEPRQLTQIGDPAGGHGLPTFSPDGRRIAFETNEFSNIPTVWTISAGGGDAKLLMPRGRTPAYAPDGRSVFYLSGSDLHQLRVTEAGEPVGEPSIIKGLVGRPAVARRVSLSADGRRMAYSMLRRSETISAVPLRPGSFEPSGPPAVIISTASTRTNFPVYSPDGRRIAYSSCSPGPTSCDVWVADADGSNQTQVTTTEGSEMMPAWFPDGRQLAFVSTRTGRSIYLAINLDTKRERPLFDYGVGSDYVRLSPDGGHVAFNYMSADGRINVWVASLAGGEPRQLTFDKVQMGFPGWSPDGRLLAFQVMRGEDTHILVMPGEGGEAEQLTNERGQSWCYGWSPDGERVLFAGFRDGLWNVWWVSRKTKEQRRLTDYRKLNSFVRYPSWSPQGDRVVYEYSETNGNIWVADLK